MTYTKKICLMLGLSLSLLGCSRTMAVKGQLEDGTRHFTGTATGYIDDSGILSIVTTDGATCEGDFFLSWGKGVLACTDGKSGTFHFTNSYSGGFGEGTIDGKAFTFAFGSKVK